MSTRRNLLTLARRYRTCPPPNQHPSPECEKNMKHHLRVCPYCAADSGLADWRALLDSISPVLSPKPEPGQGILPGQLRYISSDQACWREGYFYSPPLVLILENDPSLSDEIRVAQTYPDIGLAAPGDLILTADQTGWNDLFVECWNTYPLRAGFLGPIVGAVSEKNLASVRRMEGDPTASPKDALLPRPLKEEDPRVYFRELEAEVGYTFASRAVESLMTEHERPLLRLIDASPEELQNAIQGLKPKVEWHPAPDTPEAVFALAHLSSDAWAMAAADPGDETVPGNLFLLKKGRVQMFQTVPVQIHGWTPVEEGVEIFGQVGDIPESLGTSILLGYLYCGEGRIVSPLETEWDAAESRFRIVFSNADPKARCELSLAVVGEVR